MNDSRHRILITGARGKTGAPLADLLVARGDVDVRGGSSDPASITADNVEPIRFSWDDPSTWRPALEGIDAMYLVRPDRADAPDLIADLLGRAPSVSRVVLLSERENDRFAAGDWSPRCERAVRDSGHTWVMVRPSWFMQVFTDDRFHRADLESGRLPFASGGARVAWIDARDIAAVAERALLGGHDGEALEISGPESLTLVETAAVLSNALGRRVEHVEVSVDSAVEGMSGFERDETVWTLERLAGGEFAAITDVVEQVTGAPARPLSALFDA